jgi:hypothetical protein
MVIKVITSLALFLGVFFSSGAYCQEDASESLNIRRVSGQVCATDWVSDKLVVRTFEFGNTDEITFKVPDDTPVTKGQNNSSLANINIGDKVSVEYYRETFSGLKAVRITVKQ